MHDVYCRATETSECTMCICRATETSECMMCMESEAVILFQPCGHHIVCEECSVRMKKCFLCHEPISSKLNRGLAGMSATTVVPLSHFVSKSFSVFMFLPAR